MTSLPYALDVPNDERRREQGVENFGKMTHEAVEWCLEGDEPGQAATGP
jgi:hypothetical protein